MTLSIIDWFNNITDAVTTLKNIVTKFYETTTAIFSFIPDPFGKILGVALGAVIAITIIKIIRG